MLKPYYRNVNLDRRCREMRATGALIAFSSGIPEHRFSRILNGRLVPRPEEKKKIAEVLECNEIEIFDC
jgi:hypothetical protein